MAAVDLNILQVILALAATDMLASTLILFHPDNGGFIEAGSLNLPFNHQKSSYYEGGVRVPGESLTPSAANSVVCYEISLSIS